MMHFNLNQTIFKIISIQNTAFIYLCVNQVIFEWIIQCSDRYFHGSLTEILIRTWKCLKWINVGKLRCIAWAGLCAWNRCTPIGGETLEETKGYFRSKCIIWGQLQLSAFYLRLHVFFQIWVCHKLFYLLNNC